MIYLIKSTFCLTILFLFYHFFLQKEKMYVFNRFFLLASVLFAFLVPFVSLINITELNVIKSELLDFTDIEIIKETIIGTTKFPENYSFDFIDFALLLWGSISTLMSFKFLNNLRTLYLKINRNEQIKINEVTIVLVDKPISPHTFMKYIFFNKLAYKNGEIPDEIITHELVHAKQYHSIDIICIELFKIVFWFNPLFYFLKNAVELNHEYQADEKVVSKFNIREYLDILLQVGTQENYFLSNNINYLSTKKRLIMMTKKQSKSTLFLKKTFAILLTFILAFAFTEQVNAQGNKKGKVNNTKTTSKKHELIGKWVLIEKDGVKLIDTDLDFVEFFEEAKMNYCWAIDDGKGNIDKYTFKIDYSLYKNGTEKGFIYSHTVLEPYDPKTKPIILNRKYTISGDILTAICKKTANKNIPAIAVYKKIPQ